MPLAHELPMPPITLPSGRPCTRFWGPDAQRAMRRWFYGKRVPRRLGLEPGALSKTVQFYLMRMSWMACVHCRNTMYRGTQVHHRLMFQNKGCTTCP